MSSIEQDAINAKQHFQNGGISAIIIKGELKKYLMFHSSTVIINGRGYRFKFCSLGSGLYDLYLKY